MVGTISISTVSILNDMSIIINSNLDEDQKYEELKSLAQKMWDMLQKRCGKRKLGTQKNLPQYRSYMVQTNSYYLF